MEKVSIIYDVNVEDVSVKLQTLREEMLSVEEIANRLESKGVKVKLTVWDGIKRNLRRFSIISVKESGNIVDIDRTVYFLFIPIYRIVR